MSHGVHMLGLLPNREKIFSRSQQYSFMETKVCFRMPSDKDADFSNNGFSRWFMNTEYFPIFHIGQKKEKRGKWKGLIAVSFHCICTKRRQNVGLPPTSWPQKLPSFPEQCNQSLPSGPQIRRKLEKFGLFM